MSIIEAEKNLIEKNEKATGYVQTMNFYTFHMNGDDNLYLIELDG